MSTRTVTWLIDIGGTVWNDRNGIKRGDTMDAPTQEEADRVVAFGQADPGEVALEDLSRPHVERPGLLAAYYSSVREKAAAPAEAARLA